MLGDESCDSFLSLSPKVTVFEPIGPHNSVYFDDAGKHIFTLRSHGTMGVNVKSVLNDLVLNFRIDDEGEVLSIKFSEDNQILGIQRTHRSVDFLNFQGNSPNGIQYSQACKVLREKNTLRLNTCFPLNTCWFLWSPEKHICLTSDADNKLHMFQLKTPSVIVKGPKFPSPMSVSSSGDTIPIEQKHCFLAILYDNLYFCTLRYTNLYNGQNAARTVCFYTLKMEDPVVLTHIIILDSEGHVSFSILDNLFMVHYQSEMVTSVFDIALTGTIRDNVIHHTPILRDITIAPFNLSTKIIPALSANLDAQIPIDLCILNKSKNLILLVFVSIICYLRNDKSSNRDHFLYILINANTFTAFLVTLSSILKDSVNWTINLCSVVIDNSLGCSWLFCLNNSVFPKLVDDHDLIVNFLLHRSSGKSVLLDYFSKLVADSIKEVVSNVDKPLTYKFDGPGLNHRLDQFAFLFKRICRVNHCATKATSKRHTDSLSLSSDFGRKVSDFLAPPYPCSVTQMTVSECLQADSSTSGIISQSDIYSHLFLKKQNTERLEVRKLFCSILIEYIRIYLEHDICVDHCFYEMLLNLVARIGNYAQLSFYIQSRLLSDSKPIALQLLSLESEYPPAGQLAIDMLKRLNTCNSELFDALLIKGRPLEALRFSSLCRSENVLDMENVCNFLNVTQQIEDYMEFYCAQHFLKESSVWRELCRDSDKCSKFCAKDFEDLLPPT
ncbi:Regulator of MON1-CCZ1 complex [Schistosoma japonicum]|nr:Regulator of MON1-CCZ1 complex [Schistosoma japonicum]